MITKEAIVIATKTLEAFPGPCTTEEAMEAALTAALSVQWRGMEGAPNPASTAPRDGSKFLGLGLGGGFCIMRYLPHRTKPHLCWDIGDRIVDQSVLRFWWPLPLEPE